jgi:hypothetical protein
MSVRGMFRPGMRAYLVPLVAGLMLSLSAFLPWVHVGNVTLSGVPDSMAIWVVVLGALATVISILSLITRKNSRHPLLLIGLVSLGLMFLSWRLMPQVVAERALTRSQALAIVENTPLGVAPSAIVGIGIYLGLAASSALVGFGLTIVIKSASQPWAPVDPDDDIP